MVSSSGLVMGVLTAAVACSRGEAQQPQPAGPPPAVPVTTVAAVRKDVPLEMGGHRDRRGLLDGDGAGADHRRADHGEVPAGRRRRGGTGTVHARSAAARSGPACRPRPTCSAIPRRPATPGRSSSATSNWSSAASSPASSATPPGPPWRRSRAPWPPTAPRSRTPRCSSSTPPSARRFRAGPAP